VEVEEVVVGRQKEIVPERDRAGKRSCRKEIVPEEASQTEEGVIT
jgi:hypothetical protein